MDRPQFDRFGECPICNKIFMADACPHSFAQAQAVLEKRHAQNERRKADEEWIRKIIREEIADFLESSFVYDDGEGGQKVGRLS